MAPTLFEPASCERIEPAEGHAFVRCDDGTPQAGGAEANEGGSAAVTVPAKYDGFEGLPPKAADAGSVPGADSAGDVALDVAVSIPARKPPKAGYPLIFFMHGCCAGARTSWQADEFDAGGEKWHYSDAWFAARGYMVVTYTARGFVDRDGRGSTGETQLDSRDYEINDYQHLACQVAGMAPRLAGAAGHRVRVDPRRIVTTGGSYGGGFSWLTVTDPRWRCGADTGAQGTSMRLAASAPKYGWTDLAYSLVPTGAHSGLPDSLPATDGCDSGPRRADGSLCAAPGPVGIPKRSIVAGLYASGKAGIPPGLSHTTFPAAIDEAFACLQGVYPPEPNPACAGTIETTLPEFLADRSAYYQEGFFQRVAAKPRYRVPVFVAGAFSDPLFTSVETRRMVNRVLAIDPDYPVEAYYGDYQHFTQNKAKEWGDVCRVEGKREVCGSERYRRGFDRAPGKLLRTGLTTRLTTFIDRVVLDRGGRKRSGRSSAPSGRAMASLQVCPANAGDRPVDEPGPVFGAATFEALATQTLRLELQGERGTTNPAKPNPHAASSDPVANSRVNANACPVETGSAGPGVATYTSAPLAEEQTMIGATRVTAQFEPTDAVGLQLNARLYDVEPDGRAIMVDRGPRRLTDAEAAAGEVSFELHGNGWRFPEGDSVRVELAQDDDPFVAASSVPSSLTLRRAVLELPVRKLSGRRCAIVNRGTPFGEELGAGPGGDHLIGRGGRDFLDAGDGPDCLKGGGGADRLVGGPGRDRFNAGPGRDRIDSRDGIPEKVRCGKGRDAVTADREDRLQGCERVRRG